MTLLPLSPANKSLSKSFTTKQEKKAHDSRSTKVLSKTHMIQRRPPQKGKMKGLSPNPT
jgi:hypothetical protein